MLWFPVLPKRLSFLFAAQFPFSASVFLQQRTDQLGGYVEGSRLQLSERGREIHDLPPGGFAQHAQGADEWQLTPRSFPASLCLVEKQLIGLNLFRNGNCFPLPRIEVFKPPVRTVTERPYLKPRGRMGNPGLYQLRSFRLRVLRIRPGESKPAQRLAEARRHD